MIQDNSERVAKRRWRGESDRNLGFSESTSSVSEICATNEDQCNILKLQRIMFHKKIPVPPCLDAGAVRAQQYHEASPQLSVWDNFICTKIGICSALQGSES